MPFTTNMSGTTQVDNSIVLAYDQAFIVAHDQENVMDGLVEYRANIGAKSIEFPKYSNLALVTSGLTEDEDVTSEAMSDSQIKLTPEEYGKVVTRTTLASLQSGGKVDVAAATLVGKNMASSRNKLACLALDASTNVWSGAAGNVAAGSISGTTDIMSGAILNKVYNKLSRASVPGLGGQEYVLVAHDDVITDLRAESAWVDVAKYADAVQVLRNEVGMYKGFRVVKNNHATYADQTGAGTVDEYNSYAIGFNALGLAVSKEPGMVATGPFDKLARFVNLGWYGVFKYGIIDTDACWKIVTSSSVGANAS